MLMGVNGPEARMCKMICFQKPGLMFIQLQRYLEEQAQVQQGVK